MVSYFMAYVATVAVVAYADYHNNLFLCLSLSLVYSISFFLCRLQFTTPHIILSTLMLHVHLMAFFFFFNLFSYALGYLLSWLKD
jgi:hypothetical protein